MVAQVRSEKSRPSRDYCAHRVGLIARVSAVCLAPSIVRYLSRPHLTRFGAAATAAIVASGAHGTKSASSARSEEHTSELQSQSNLVCRLLLEKKKTNRTTRVTTLHKHI